VLDVGVCAAYQAGVFFDLEGASDVPGNPDGGTGPVIGPDAGSTPAGGDAGIGVDQPNESLIGCGCRSTERNGAGGNGTAVLVVFAAFLAVVRRRRTA
jgi:MYXO-CTERM domain-containing protein